MAREKSAEGRDRMVVARLCSLTVIAFDDSCAAGTVEAKLPETTLEPAQSGLDGALFGQNPRTRHMESRMSPQTDLLYASHLHYVKRCADAALAAGGFDHLRIASGIEKIGFHDRT